MINLTGRPLQADRARSQATGTHRVARAQQGKEEAFASLYNIHKRRAYSFCLHMIHDPVEAEKILEQAFQVLFSKVSTFRGESDFSAELYRTLSKAVLMRLHEKATPVGVGGGCE